MGKTSPDCGWFSQSDAVLPLAGREMLIATNYWYKIEMDRVKRITEMFLARTLYSFYKNKILRRQSKSGLGGMIFRENALLSRCFK